MTSACCRTFTCRLDNLLHAHDFTVRFICDRHDRQITGDDS